MNYSFYITKTLLFAKEYKWRKKVACLNYQAKLKNLQNIFIHVSETVNFELIEKSSNQNYNKIDYESDFDESSSNEDKSEDSGNNEVEL